MAYTDYKSARIRGGEQKKIRLPEAATLTSRTKYGDAETLLLLTNALEGNRRVVDREKVRPAEQERERAAGGNMALRHQARHDHSPLARVPLPRDEGRHEQRETDEQADDRAAVPRPRLPAVLRSQAEGHEGADDQRDAREVGLQDLLLPRRGHGLRGLRRAEEEQDDEDSDLDSTKKKADWQRCPKRVLLVHDECHRGMKASPRTPPTGRLR